MEEAEEGRKESAPGRREGNWAGGRKVGSRGGRELTCSLKNEEKLVKGRENPRVTNRGKLLAMGYVGGEGSEVVEKETAKPQSGRRSQWSNSNAAADLPSVRTVPGCCALRKIAAVSAGMGPAHFDRKFRLRRNSRQAPFSLESGTLSCACSRLVLLFPTTLQRASRPLRDNASCLSQLHTYLNPLTRSHTAALPG